jgi:hypothetical protein
MNTDHIAYYTEQDLLSWLAEFNKPENAERIILPHVPFSYYEIARALQRIDNIKGALESNDPS